MGHVKIIAIAGAIATLALPGTAGSAANTAVLVPSIGAVTWSKAPATLPAGSQIVLLAGDPSKPGPFVLRLKFPANITIAPHRHATAENVTVLTGGFYHEIGPTIDRSKGKMVGTGGFVYLPGMTPHALWTTQETIVQVTGTGPFGLLYVNSKDDPSKAH